MRTQRTAQLPLLEVADDKPHDGARQRGGRRSAVADADRAARAAMARRSQRRGPLSPEMTVKLCNDLLAALDRVEEARQQSLGLEDGRAEHLAHLFEAAVRTGDAAAAPRRRQGAA